MDHAAHLSDSKIASRPPLPQSAKTHLPHVSILSMPPPSAPGPKSREISAEGTPMTTFRLPPSVAQEPGPIGELLAPAVLPLKTPLPPIA